MYDGWHDWGPGAWIAMGLMMIVFWGLVVALIVYVVRNISGRPTSGPGSDGESPEHAQQILDERLARGEIDAEEYKQRRDLLSTR
jgi:putative membrane protein